MSGCSMNAPMNGKRRAVLAKTTTLMGSVQELSHVGRENCLHSSGSQLVIEVSGRKARSEAAERVHAKEGSGSVHASQTVTL